MMDITTTEKSKEELLEEITRLKAKLQQYEQSKKKNCRREENAKVYDLACWHDLSGRIIRVNDEVEELFEVQATDGTWMHLKNMLAPDVRQDFDTYLQRIRDERSTRGYLKTVDKFGNVRMIEYITHLEDQDQKKPYVRCIGRDVTRLKQLTKSPNEFYKSLFNTNSSSIIILNKQGSIIDVNQTAISYFNLNKNQLLSLGINELLSRVNMNTTPLQSVLKEVWRGKTIKSIWSGKDLKGKRFRNEITFKKGRYYDQDVIIFFGLDVTKESDKEEEIIHRYNELKIIKETIRFISGEYKIDHVLLMALSKLQELNYLKAAGYYQVSHTGYHARLKFHINIDNPILRHVKEIRVDEYSTVFHEKQSLQLPEGRLCEEQDGALLFIPIVVENKVSHAFLFELDKTRKNSNLLLNLLGAEISSYITQAQLNNKLVQSENRFRIIADNSPSLLRTTDANHNFVFFSKQWLAFTGRSAEAEAKQGWLESVHLEDRENLLSNLKEDFSERNRFELSYRLRRYDGEYRWMLDNGTPYYDREGEFKGYICSAVDITERKQKESEKSQEDAIKYSKERLQKALIYAHFFAITVEATGNISFCNDYFFKVTGWNEKEVLNQDLFNIFTPDPEDQEGFRLDSFLNTFEGKLQTKHGELLHISFNSIVLNDKTGNISSLTIVGEDITEKIRVTQALHESNRLLQDLFDNANDLIQVISVDGTFLFVNNAWKKTLGYSEEELAYLHLKNIIHPDYYVNTSRSLVKVSKTGSMGNFETAFVTKNGKKINLKGSISCNYEDGKPSMYRAILYDVTDQLRAEKSQTLYYSIARLTVNSTNLENLYHNFYQELRKTIDVDSFLIALKSEKGEYIYFPYYVNSPYAPVPEHGIQGREFAQHAVSFDRPMFFYDNIMETIIQRKQLHIEGSLPKVWMGVPLKLEDKVIGMIVVQSFKDRKSYNKKDLELLTFISGQLASAIQRNQNQEKINQQAARLQAVFESGTHLMWTVNRQMQVTRFNQNFADSVYDQYDMELKELAELAELYGRKSEEHRDFWFKKYAAALSGDAQQFELKLTSCNNREIWHEIFLNPIISNNLEIEEVSGVAHDITEKKMSEFSLSESEEKFRTIFESFQDVYFRTDLSGIITMISPSVIEFLGEVQEDVLDKSITDYYLSKHKLQFLLGQLKLHGSVKNFESKLVDKNGNVKSVISNFRLIYDKKGFACAIEGVARDITDLKKASEELRMAKDIAEKSLEVKKRFLSNMSHEIRTPMNGIIGMIDLMAESDLDEEQQLYVSTIKKSSETLLTILNDILDLSKIEAGKMELRKAPMSLPLTVDKLYALFSQQALARDIDMSYEISHDVPPYILADETRLLQILSNLTSNAIKFTENGEIKIVITRVAEKNEDRLHTMKVEVRDTGIGIARENLDLLFRKFSQVDNSYTKSYGGTGLGLAISQELCSLMNGEIGVVSAQGKGSTFWFTFEAVQCEASDVQTINDSAETSITGQIDSSPRVLVVDDNMINLKVAGSILRKAGCRVETASSGRAAIQLVQQHLFDVIFMDIQMPVMNGITTSQKIKKMRIKPMPPIIAMTAFSLQEERDSFLKAGMDDYISKPIKAQSLIGKVKAWIKQDVPIAEVEVVEEEVTEKIVNVETANQLKKYGGQEMLQSVYDEFEEETTQLLKDCFLTADGGDYKETLGLLHTIKGTAGTLGVERVSAQAARAEAKLKQQVYDHVQADLKVLQELFNEFKEQYKLILDI